MLKFNDFLNESFLPKHLQEQVDEFTTFEKRVWDRVKDIIMEEEGISEKNFRYINAMNKSFLNFVPEFRSQQEYHDDMKEMKEKRISYTAEMIYDKYIKGKFKISM
jgi:hypothetical protein